MNLGKMSDTLETTIEKMFSVSKKLMVINRAQTENLKNLEKAVAMISTRNSSSDNLERVVEPATPLGSSRRKY